MTTALDRIRIRLAEAEACKAMMVFNHQGIDARVRTWRDAEAECLAALQPEAPAPAPIVALPPLALMKDIEGFTGWPSADDSAAAWNSYVAPRDRAARDSIDDVARQVEAFGDLVADLVADIQAGTEEAPPAAPPQPEAAAPAPEPPRAADADDAPPAPEPAREIPADTAAVIQQHHAFMDPSNLPDPPAMPKARDWPAHPVRTPERMAAFPALWLSRAPTSQLQIALAAMPGEPLTRKGTLYDMARDWGLPTSRMWTLTAAPAPGQAAPQPLASTQRTPERMSLFRTLWMDARLTVPQILARLNELPGKPIVTTPSLYGWAKVAGLPTQRPQPDEAPEPLPDLPAPPPPRAAETSQPAAGGAEAEFSVVGADGQSLEATASPQAQRAQAPQPQPPAPPPAEPPGPITEGTLTPEQREAIRRLRGQAYNVEAIAKRTRVPLDVVQALDAQAERVALDLLAIPSDTDTIFLETGLTPTRIKALRDRAKQRAA